MKILIIAGSEHFLYGFKKELICALAESGHEIVVSTPTGSMHAELAALPCRIIDTPVDRRGLNPLKDAKLYRQYKKMMAQEQPDKVITYTVKCNVYGGMAARKKKIPYYTNVTGVGTGFQKKLLRRIVIFLYKKALKNVSGVFFENDANRDVFIKNKIIGADKAVSVNGSGVNLEEFSYKELPGAELPDEAFKTDFLFLGRVMKEKGIDEFLCCAKKAKEEALDAAFSIVGGLEENYKERLEALNADGTVRYYGFQKDVKPFIERCDCVVLPSYHEGMSNTLLEGAAMGRPLITSDIPGCQEAVLDGESGYLAQKSNADDLYDKIKKYLSLDVEARNVMSLASRAHMEAHFDRKEVVQKTLEVIL
ncbi:MAG: glycosyltransferase family 4 protein [Firmicutes bacterium]|nr:glycosyltransferase family 4 protein [Bacillota bacterium]